MAWLLRLCGLLRGRSGKAIFASLCAAVVSAAFAESGCVYQYKSVNYPTGAAACAAYVSDVQPGNPTNGYNLQSVEESPGSARCVFRVTGAGGGSWTEYVNIGKTCQCPQGSTDPKCNDPCAGTKDQTQIINATAAWQRTPNTAPNQEWLHPTKWVYGGMNRVCGPDKCELAFDPLEPCPDCGSYVSQVPASNGMYRVSIDMLARGTGGQCSPSDNDNPITPNDAKDPPCPGFVGEVNGVRGCYGTAEKPIRPEAPSGPANGPDREGGNPSAGKKPGSGEGSGSGGAGRTPSQGSGGSQGGPASAAGGKKPDGTTPTPAEGKQQAACGAPGQPKCKIDETGTPDGKSVFDGPKKSLDDAFVEAKKQLDGVKSAGDKDTGWGVVPSWMQHASCTPWSLGTLPIGDGREITIDVCRIMPYIEAVTSFLWAITTFVATLAMVFRVTTASKG